ncbi:MAG: hypothetical protein Q9223_005877 [Gallowayella weberi]
MDGIPIRTSENSLMNELGLYSFLKLLCLQRFLRLLAYGASTLILALYLSTLGISDARIGLFMGMTLWGDLVIGFFLTLLADGLGRRRILMLGAALMTASGLAFILSDNYWVLVAASIIGVISPSGNEIGPFKAIEESTLSQLSPAEIRRDIFAWYIPWRKAGSSSHPSAILLKLSVLFSIDSFASSLATSTWLTYFFVMKISLPEGYLGTLFFTSSIIAALSNLVATSISKRIGLLKTKVVTHLPSAIFLALIPLPSTVFPAMTLLVLRTCTQNMDQAPRQAFLAAAVLPSERTAMMGL